MLSKLLIFTVSEKARYTLNKGFVSKALVIMLITSAIQIISNSSALAVIPESARLIGDTRGSKIPITNPSNLTNGARCLSGTRGIATDGTFVYFRPVSDFSTGLICKAQMNGVLVDVRTVSTSSLGTTLFSLGVENLDLTYSAGCIFVRALTVQASVNCIATSDWSFTKIDLPNAKPFFAGSFWLAGNLIDFPDGRIGAVSGPNQALATGTGPNQCPSGQYCKILRLYSVSGTGKNISLTFSEDIVLADSESGWPSDDHGIATDGTYLYQIKHAAGYKVWELKSNAPSSIIFNGDGVGTCGASLDISGRQCTITNPINGTTSGGLSNATFMSRNHTTNQYLIGDYQSGNFYASIASTPPAGVGSDKSITFTTAVAANLKYGSTTSATYSVNRSLGTEASPNLTGTITYETVTSTACNINSSTGLVTMLRATGACQVRVKLVSDAFYSDTSSVVVAITPAKADTLTVTASAVDMTYNGSSQTIPYTYSISGLKFSDTVTALSYGYSGTANSGSVTTGTSSITAGGTFTITPSAAGISNSDSYTAISYATGALTVNRAARTITGSAAGTVKYGSQETITVTTSPSSNSDGAQSFSAGSSTACSVVSGTGVLTMNRAAGTCSIVPSIAQGANYLSATGSAVAITPAKADAISLAAVDKSSTYTGSASAITPTYSVSGLQFSDTVTVTYNYSGTANGGASYSLSATKPTNAGIYSIVPSVTFTNSDSYTAPSANLTNGTLTINRATRTLSPTTYSSTSLKFGDTATVTSNTTSPSSNSDGAFLYTVGAGCSIDSSTGQILATTYSGSCLETTTVTQGNNYETATATALTFTLSKADTLTVTTATPSALTYTGSAAAVTPTVTVSGLVAGNTATGATFNFSRTPTCAQGGVCQVGDTGPGGGKVFYVSGSAINAVSGVSGGGIYLEMAPATFSKTTFNWCEGPGNPYTTLLGATATNIGSGAANTKIMIDNCTGGAGVEAVNLTLGGKSDWFLPSYGELLEIYSERNMLGLGSGEAAASYLYWSSTEADTWIASSLVPWAGVGGQNKGQATPYLPIRAFSATVSAYSASVTAPTNAGSYVITPSLLTLGSGITTDYYKATIYETATLTINKASQSAFTNYSYLSGIFGTAFIIYKFGGSGDGAETIAVANGSATGCELSGVVLFVTTAGTCVVTATKATSENYLVSTSEFTVIMNYYVPEPAAPVSTMPTEIAIASATGWSIAPSIGPTITGISPSSGPVGTVVTITGTGMNGVDVIKIGRKALTSITGISSTSVSGVIPAGATTGPIFVSNSLGSDFNSIGFTVTP